MTVRQGLWTNGSGPRQKCRLGSFYSNRCGLPERTRYTGPRDLCRSKCDYLCEIYVRTAGTLYGRIGWASMEPYGTCHGPDGLQVRHRAAGPSGRRTDDADTHGWTSRPRAHGACSRSEPTAACPGFGLGSLESTHRWTEQHGLRHCTEWGRRTFPGWSR